MKNKITVLLTLACILFSSPSFSEKIIWETVNWPPFEYKEDGEFKGYGVEWMKMLQAELPQYTHEFSQSTMARLLLRMKNQEKVCTSGLYKTPDRDKLVYYSIPDVLWFPAQLFMLKEKHAELGSPQTISLRSLLENKKGTLGTVTGAENYPGFNAIYTDFKDSPQLNEVSSVASVKSLFSMLLLKRIDFVIEFAPEGRYAARLEGGEDKVRSVIIEEAEAFSTAYTMCSQSAWGKKAISDINKALIKLRPTDKWRNNYGRFLDPHVLPVYQQKYDEILLPIVE